MRIRNPIKALLNAVQHKDPPRTETTDVHVNVERMIAEREARDKQTAGRTRAERHRRKARRAKSRLTKKNRRSGAIQASDERKPKNVVHSVPLYAFGSDRTRKTTAQTKRPGWARKRDRRRERRIAE